MAYDVGTAFLNITPSFDGITRDLRRISKQIADDLDKAIGGALPKSVREGAARAEREARAAGEKLGGTFAEGLHRQTERALKALPDVKIDADATAAHREIASVRADLAALRDQRIGVDLDDATAVAAVEQMRHRLNELARTSPSVQVRVDAAGASAELAGVSALVERVDGRRVGIDVDTGGGEANLSRLASTADFSMSRLGALIATGASLGSAIVPAAAAAASAIGFIGTAAAASLGGVATLALGFSGVADAVKALGAVEKDAAKNAAGLAGAQASIAGALAGVTSAERSLANTRASNADGARRATQQVADAERAYARVQVDARLAQLDLTRARQEARRALQDMQLDLEGVAIAQRQANLDQADAKRELDKVLADPKATKEQREQAQITYDSATLRIKDLSAQQQRLAADTKVANKAGVEGSRQVQAAQLRVRDTTERVAAAQRAVADATRAQQAQQRQAAFAVAQAQQSVINAQRQLQQTTVRAGVAGSASMDKLAESMAALSPTGQRFARFIFGLRDEFDGLRDAASSNLLPGVQRSIESLLPSLPKFSDYVGRVASAIGAMFEETAQFLRVDPTWRRFWSHMDTETVPTLERLYRIGRNTATGLLGLYMAFTPFNEDIGGGLESLTERFAKWSAQLETDQGFQKFLDYVRENGPKVAHLIGEITTFAINFIEAVAPVGTFVVAAFTKLFEALNTIPTGGLQAIAIAIAAITAAALALSAGLRVLNLFNSAVATLTTARDNFAKVTGAIDGAAAGTGRFRDAAIRTKTAGLNLKDGLASLAGFLAGPWGVALGAATLAAGYFAQKSAEQKQKVDDLSTALGLLGKAYKETRNVSSDAVKDIVAQSKELQTLVNNADLYGVSVENIAKAAAGERDAQQSVIASLKARQEALRNLGNEEAAREAREGKSIDAKKKRPEYEQARAIGVLIDALGGQFEVSGLAAQAQAALDAAQRNSTGSAKLVTEEQRKVADQITANATKIGVLTGLVDAFGNAQSTAAQRAGALRAAIELQTGAAISANEAEERWRSTMFDLAESVKTNGTAVDLNSQAALDNRDAVEAAARAARDRYLADIESNVPMADATKAHEGRIATLVAEADKLGLTKTETEKLIAAYGRVDPSVSTAFTTTGLAKVYEDLQNLEVAQLALKQGIPVDQAAKEYRKQRQKANSFLGAGGAKDGGQIFGAGTATSDSIPIWLSNREFVEPVASVDYYGAGLFEALRQRRIPREIMPGFRKGGMVGWPFPVSAAMTRIPSMDEVRKSVAGEASGPISGGSQRMMQILRLAFPGLALMSGYRPGDRVASGELSYHARNRAVDLPPRMDVFNWIKAHYPNSRELIHTQAGGRQIWNGREHTFTPDVAAGHWDHVHWAYDQGGMLPPGVSTVLNATGKPEPVLTDQQWGQISALARGNSSDGPRTVHNWNFKEAALDMPRLQAWQDRQDALARVSRPG